MDWLRTRRANNCEGAGGHRRPTRTFRRGVSFCCHSCAYVVRIWAVRSYVHFVPFAAPFFLPQTRRKFREFWRVLAESADFVPTLEEPASLRGFIRPLDQQAASNRSERGSCHNLPVSVTACNPRSRLALCPKLSAPAKTCSPENLEDTPRGTYNRTGEPHTFKRR